MKQLVSISKDQSFPNDIDLAKTWMFGNFKGYLVEFKDDATCTSHIVSMNSRTDELRRDQRSEHDSKLLADSDDQVRATVGSTASQYDTENWGLDRIDQQNLPLNNIYRFPETAGENAIVYIIDTGIKMGHVEFENRVEWGTNVIDSVNDDENGHGTHVAAIAAGSRYGVAKKARLVAIKALDRDGSGSFSNVIDGLQYIANRVMNGEDGPKTHIINLSVQGRTNAVFNRALNAMSNLNVHIVVASGNDAVEACSRSPASASLNSSIISVGAIDRLDMVGPFSNFGICTNILAPGVEIVSANFENLMGNTVKTGTSMASPHVAGLIAILTTDTKHNVLKTPIGIKTHLLSVSRDNRPVFYAGIAFKA